jgi:hypothetical protein
VDESSKKKFLCFISKVSNVYFLEKPFKRHLNIKVLAKMRIVPHMLVIGLLTSASLGMIPDDRMKEMMQKRRDSLPTFEVLVRVKLDRGQENVNVNRNQYNYLLRCRL